MPEAKKIRRLGIERGMCFGTCPVYAVAVKADGSVRWRGRIFVDALGPRTWTVGSARIAALEDALSAAAFEDMEIDPDCVVCDVATVRVVVVYADGTRKIVEHYDGPEWAPRRLLRLERQVDRILGTEVYVGHSALEC